jgi:adenylate cyclase
MGIEIERKFLVRGDGWKEGADGVRYKQGYVMFGPPASVRARIAGDKAFLTIKKSTLSISRYEFEYVIPIADAEIILDSLCSGPIVEKTRYKKSFAGMLWEIDVFEGDNAGLIVAEIELSSEDQQFEIPPWIGEEVSGDPRYHNTNLSRRPYSQWGNNATD